MLALGLLSACGAGTAGIVAGSSDSGGGSTPALDSFVLENPKESPSLLRLDASEPVRVGLFYDRGSGEQAMTRLVGVAGNEVDLPAGELPLEWDFAAEPGIGTASFTSGVRVLAKRGGAVLSGGELTLGLGNDSPVVLSIDQIDIDPDEDQATGTTGIELTVADSSDDVVSVKIEFDIQGDTPDAGWQLARPGLVEPGLPTPEFGIADVQVSRGAGTQLRFFWDTDSVTDLKDLERDVRLRFTATDGFLTGAPLFTPTFRVDNNEEPIVQLDSGPLILNPDERRGIPIPFRVIDEEGDLVEVIFQWRREGEEFPSLDSDGDGEVETEEVDAILADPVLRQERHVCTEYPHYAQGLVVPVDADTVRLPELARGESWILASGIVGRTLELLRPSSIPAPITPTWSSNPLVSPIAALPVGDGLTALVLDVPGNGRLREIELATGAIVREIAIFGPGMPTAMTLQRGEKAVLVALDDAGVWRIERVELASGAITELVVSDGTHPAPVRGIASLGTRALVFTAGSSLLFADVSSGALRMGTILSDLETPWGLLLDPRQANRVLVAEHGADRVVSIGLDSHQSLPVVVSTESLVALERPTALASEREGARLLVVTRGVGDVFQLVGLDLGTQGGNLAFAIGGLHTTEIASLASGPDGLRLATQPRAHQLLCGGGAEQRRTIVSLEPVGQHVALEAALQPGARAGQGWRIAHDPRRLRASTGGVEATVLWSSGTDVPAGGDVLVRAVARDDELGTTATGLAPKAVRAGLDVEPLVLDGTAGAPLDVTVADLDDDGDLDIVCGESSISPGLAVYFQEHAGSFTPVPLVLPTSGIVPPVAADLDGDTDIDLVAGNQVFFQTAPGSFATPPLVLPTTNGRSLVADLDGDGDLDLAIADSGRDALEVHYQTSPGGFTPQPQVLSGASGPVSIAAADFDRDGDLDLVSACFGTSDLRIFFQSSPGVFSVPPRRLGGPSITLDPRSVAAADLDGDGDIDVVSANTLGDDLTVFFQTSPGRFALQPERLGGTAFLDAPFSVAVADLDGDGDLDLASANEFSHDLTVFFQESPGSFASHPTVLGDASITRGACSVAAADLDGDGDSDLVSANRINGSLTAFLQASPGDIAAQPSRLGTPSMIGPFSVAAGDLDGDGDLDLVSANRTGGNLAVFFQASPGVLMPQPLMLGNPLVSHFPSSVVAADLDRDGDLDVASANSSNLTVFFQTSPGRYAPQPLTLDGPSVSGCRALAAADLDGDGAIDLATATNTTLAVFFADMPGSFAPPLVLAFPQFVSPFAVAAADFDHDGDMDLASANRDSNQADSSLWLFSQTQPRSFSTQPVVLGPISGQAVSVAAADLEGDGDLDLVGGSEAGFAMFFQDSSGSFATPPRVLPGTESPCWITVADLDGDGDVELISANEPRMSGTIETGSNLTVYSQTSPGTFATRPLVLGGPPITPVACFVEAVDLDGDGDQDLVSASSPNDLTVFWGGR